MLENRQRRMSHERFDRLATAWHAAIWHGLYRSAKLFREALEANGGWQDEDEIWHDDIRPMKPIDDAPGADMSAGWEL